jgi:ABC-type Mn2+/Zn2+ transport system permease subunit
VHTVFLALVVPNLVAGFPALGTLMAVGLMMPANGPNARSYNITG